MIPNVGNQCYCLTWKRREKEKEILSILEMLELKIL